MSEDKKNNFGLQNKKKFLEQLIGKEIKVNVYGSSRIGILKEIDAENIYLSPHMVIEFLPNKHEGKIQYRIETDYALPIPKIAVCAPEKLSEGYMKKLATLGNKKENKLEKELNTKMEIELIYEKLKKTKADVRINLEGGNEKIGKICKIDDYFIYLKPYIIFEEFFVEKEFTSFARLENEIALPIPKRAIMNPERLQKGYIDYLMKVYSKFDLIEKLKNISKKDSQEKPTE